LVIVIYESDEVGAAVKRHRHCAVASIGNARFRFLRVMDLDGQARNRLPANTLGFGIRLVVYDNQFDRLGVIAAQVDLLKGDQQLR
jgi:hypothetical protein